MDELLLIDFQQKNNTGYRKYRWRPSPWSVSRSKRFFDITLALFLIISVLSWLVLLLFPLIKFSSKGPLFFTQKRVGRDGFLFPCYKFRTMYLNEHADILQCSENDERITAIGKFLRKSHIDELPQLINVLKNEMSLVGPRPHMKVDDWYFSKIWPCHSFRYKVKPGITGLAQSMGYYGFSQSKRQIVGRSKLDVFYVRNTSFWLDLKIIYNTLYRSLFKKKLYGKNINS